ncbi:hypothetical protein ACF1AB_39200 [Streptomyces sp. NPDC014846]|uniref:hypothetical protein n=1 Tax=Streptomyces sp. NPDC014846 TaxID=3364922 RepID=UPI0036FAEAE7
MAGGAAPHRPADPGLPPYRRTAADLRQQILSERLKPGERLPPLRLLQHPA